MTSTPDIGFDFQAADRENYIALERWAHQVDPNNLANCLLIFPFKSQFPLDKQQALTAIERWSRTLSYPLHIPLKDWSGNDFELQNLLAIERWANQIV